MRVTYRYTLDLHYSLSRLPNADTSPEADPTDDSDVDYADHPHHPSTHADDYTYVDLTDGGGDHLTLTFGGFTEDRHTYTLADSLGVDALTHELGPCECDDHDTDRDALVCALRDVLDGARDGGSGWYFEPTDAPHGYGHADPVSACVTVHLEGADDLLPFV